MGLLKVAGFYFLVGWRVACRMFAAGSSISLLGIYSFGWHAALSSIALRHLMPSLASLVSKVAAPVFW